MRVPCGAGRASWQSERRPGSRLARGSLSAIGWVQQVIVNRRTGFVVDGRLCPTICESALPVCVNVECEAAFRETAVGSTFSASCSNASAVIGSEAAARSGRGRAACPGRHVDRGRCASGQGRVAARHLRAHHRRGPEHRGGSPHSGGLRPRAGADSTGAGCYGAPDRSRTRAAPNSQPTQQVDQTSATALTSM